MALDKDFSWSEVGARIRDLRKQLNMSQQALASAAGITQNGVFRLEAGKTNPQLATLQQIAAVLGCSVRYLVSGAPDREPAFADRYRRVQRIVESGDDVAIRAMDSGLENARELLERGGSRREQLSGRKLMLKGSPDPDDLFQLYTSGEIPDDSARRIAGVEPKADQAFRDMRTRNDTTKKSKQL